MGKRILSFALALCLLLALMPQTSLTAAAYLDTDIAYAVEGGNIYFNRATGTITDCDRDVTSANIPAEIDGVAVTGVGNAAFQLCTQLTSVTIPNGVIRIGRFAFHYCSQLLNITIPDRVTQIGEGAFSYCGSLLSVTLPDDISRIEDYTFLGCSNLTSITIPDGVTSIGMESFSDCTALASITVPDSVISIGGNAFSGTAIFDNESNWVGDILYLGHILMSAKKTLSGSFDIPEGTTGIAYEAFAGCNNLTRVTIPDSVTNIGESAFDSTAIYNNEDNWTDGILYIDAWLIDAENSSGVVIIPDGTVGIAAHAFDWNSKVTGVTIADTVSVIGDQAFYNCYNITSVTMSDGIVSIGDYAFTFCNALNHIVIPASITGIGRSAFSSCYELANVEIPASVTSIGNGAFSGCGCIRVDAGNRNYYSDDCGILFDKEQTRLIHAPQSIKGNYVIPTGVLYIEEQAFRGCDELTSVTIPVSTNCIGATAFADCEKLDSIYFLGDSPMLEGQWYKSEIGHFSGNTTLYYVEGRQGWTSPTWNGYPTATWEPPHEHSYTAVVTEPTCTEQGYTTYTCDCGDSYVDTYVDALGHDFVINTCSRCGTKGTGKNFSDVSDESWFYDYVVAATNLGLVNGYEDNTFRPFGSLTRAEAVTLLYRAAGSPAVTGRATFTDLDGQWYQNAICWAQQNKVVNGISATEFAPNTPISREAFLTMIWRAAGSPAAEGSLSNFADTAELDTWAVTAFAWAVEKGIINGTTLPGKTGLHLAPLNNITRAEAAKILVVYTGL